MLEYLDRQFSVVFQYDKKKKRGIPDLLDAAQPPGQAKSVRRVTFDVAGETDHDGGYPDGKMQLGLVQDCIAMAACFIDAGLDKSPVDYR